MSARAARQAHSWYLYYTDREALVDKEPEVATILELITDLAQLASVLERNQ